jgi:hypothetical protein
MMNKTGPKQEDPSLPEVVNLSGARAENVAAELVRVRRSLVRDIDATEAEIHQSGALMVNGEYVSAHSAVIGVVQSGAVTVNGGAVGFVQTQDAGLTGPVGVVVGDEVVLTDSATVGVLGASSVKAEHVRTVVLLARNVEGSVETALDTRQVVLASVVAGIAAGAVVQLGQMLFGRSKK